jgi:hypothetical protein
MQSGLVHCTSILVDFARYPCSFGIPSRNEIKMQFLYNVKLSFTCFRQGKLS